MTRPQSQEITQKSQSNLAFAFITVPKDRRADMTSYYAFCRVVDDIVDEPGPSDAERRDLLARWRRVIDGGVSHAEPLEREVISLMEKYALPKEHLLLLIEGMEMDLDRRRYDTVDDLLGYCYRVASSVGLVTVRILGCGDDAGLAYGESLGYCLQLTNILRDVGEDWRRFGRVYLPREEMAEYGLTEDMIAAGHSQIPAFQNIAAFQDRRAREYYLRTEELLPPGRTRQLLVCESMRKIYLGILEKMKADGFCLLEKQYRLTRLEKLGILTRQAIASLLKP